MPTRGVIFARTILSTILNPELPKDSHIIIVDGLPIPEAHNECVRRALATDCTHIWFTEEDMEIKHGALTEMMKEALCERPYVAVNYPLTDRVRSCFRYDGKKLLWTGLGCTLIERKIFEDIGDPYFTTDYEIQLSGTRIVSTNKVDPAMKDKIYGRHDAWFGYQLNQKGVELYGIPDYTCNHLRMRTWERKIVNAGQHEIYEL